MYNYKLTIQYDGTRYRGWQVQGNTDQTIQGKVEGVLSRLTGQPVELHGSGRTDAGVHALGQVANVKLPRPFDPSELLRELNRYLPADIGVIAVEPAPERFHARLNAHSKTYRYRIWNSEIPNVLERSYLYPLPEPLDVAAMEQAAADLVGTHDFRSFCGLKRFKKSTVRTITDIIITQHSSEVRLEFTGNGFLMRMVRILAGTLVEVGLGQRAADAMPAVLAAQDRAAAGPALPAQGLALVRVEY
mgnify:FL=1